MPVQVPLALVQAPVLALLVQGLVQGLVPAQGPQVRPGLQVLRLVAVVLAFLSLSFCSVSYTQLTLPTNREE